VQLGMSALLPITTAKADTETGMNVLSCTMIVTNANASAGKVHDRMPVLLQPEDFPRWLSGTTNTTLIEQIAA
jgi:putative SOS response-associated peptidase YedK